MQIKFVPASPEEMARRVPAKPVAPAKKTPKPKE
jgi:hypothetical protein